MKQPCSMSMLQGPKGEEPRSDCEAPTWFSELLRAAESGARYRLPDSLQFLADELGSTAAYKALKFYDSEIKDEASTRSRLRALAFRIGCNEARRVALSETRRRELRQRFSYLFDESSYHCSQFLPPDELLGAQEDQEMLRTILKSAIPDAIAALDRIDQEIVRRAHLEQQSSKQIADALAEQPFCLKLSSNAVRQRLSRACGTLRAEILKAVKGYPEATAIPSKAFKCFRRRADSIHALRTVFYECLNWDPCPTWEFLEKGVETLEVNSISAEGIDFGRKQISAQALQNLVVRVSFIETNNVAGSLTKRSAHLDFFRFLNRAYSGLPNDFGYEPLKTDEQLSLVTIHDNEIEFHVGFSRHQETALHIYAVMRALRALGNFQVSTETAFRATAWTSGTLGAENCDRISRCLIEEPCQIAVSPQLAIFLVEANEYIKGLEHKLSIIYDPEVQSKQSEKKYHWPIISFKISDEENSANGLPHCSVADRHNRFSQHTHELGTRLLCNGAGLV